MAGETAVLVSQEKHGGGESMTLYKITGLNGEAIHGGNGKWSLPKGRKPGAWMPAIDNIQPCERGYHLVSDVQLLAWLAVGIVWEAEGRGKFIQCNDKSVWPEARLLRKVGALTQKSLRLFAADCAERVLPIFEKEFPNDDRPRRAIKAARDFARGKISDAARAAARAAAGAAARAAARAAAWAAARDAALYAARAAQNVQLEALLMKLEPQAGRRLANLEYVRRLGAGR
jgi:hypothetical protein